MGSKDTNRCIEEFYNFRKKWSPKRMYKLAIEEYTNNKNDSFIYDMEYNPNFQSLGSIKGGASNKFGIYHIKRKSNINKGKKGGIHYGEKYAYKITYGKSENEAYNNIIDMVNNIINDVQSGNFANVKSVDFWPVYKWKIAFLYQNPENIKVLPIYSWNALHYYITSELKIYSSEGAEELNQFLLNDIIIKHHDINTLEEAFEISEKIWNTWNARNKNIEDDKKNELHNLTKELREISQAISTKIETIPCEVDNDDKLHFLHNDEKPPSDLLEEIRLHVKDLLPKIENSNAYPTLYEALKRYQIVINEDEISISKLYGAGISLINVKDAIENDEDSPDLDPDKKPILGTIITLHQTYIMSDDEGRKLVEAAIAYETKPKQTEELKEVGRSLTIQIVNNNNIGDDIKEHIKTSLEEVGKGRQPERSNQLFITGVVSVASGLIVSGLSGSIPVEMATSGISQAINWGWQFILNNKDNLLSMVSIFKEHLSVVGEVMGLLKDSIDLIEKIRNIIKRR